MDEVAVPPAPAPHPLAAGIDERAERNEIDSLHGAVVWDMTFGPARRIGVQHRESGLTDRLATARQAPPVRRTWGRGMGGVWPQFGDAPR